jgi:hypothetical protein
MRIRPAEEVLPLLVADYESLQIELDEAEDEQDRLEVLRDHLDRLAAAMREAKTLCGVGSLLAENLLSSLQQITP